MVRISLVNDHTLRTLFPAAGASSPPVVEGVSPPVAGASVAPPPQAAKSILASTNKLKTKKIDLRMFLLLQVRFFNGLYYFRVESSPHDCAGLPSPEKVMEDLLFCFYSRHTTSFRLSGNDTGDEKKIIHRINLVA
jgi:hypothetical protein